MTLTSLPISAQVIPDRQKVVRPSKVRNIGSKYVITNGTKRGRNLFYKFKEFSVDSRSSAKFINPRSTENMVILVSGNRRSVLNGYLNFGDIKNLFFLNSNGISVLNNFSSSKLKSINLSTANSIVFSDNYEFIVNSTLRSSKVNSFPDKLIFRDNKGSINISNKGAIFSVSPIGTIVSNNFPDKFLGVEERGRIFLSATSVNLDGGLLYAPDGEIIIKGKQSGEISLNKVRNLKKSDVQGEINLRNYSAIDVSGQSSGKIFLGSERMNINSGSTVISQTLSNKDSGIFIVSKNLNVVGVEEISNILVDSFANPLTEEIRYITSINHLNLHGDKKAIIDVVSDDINLSSGAAIAGIGVLNGSGADVNFEANNISIFAGKNIIPLINTSVFAVTSSDNIGGSIHVNADTLSVLGGSRLGTISLLSGEGGSIKVTASKVLVDGIAENGASQSAITAFTAGSGSSGDVKIKSGIVKIVNQGTISNASLGQGDTGTLKIQANQVDILGNGSAFAESGQETGISSLIFPNEAGLNEIERRRIAEIQNFNGDSGGIELSANNLNVDNGVISVDNFGTGEGGDLSLSVTEFNLDSSRVSANTLGGNGGNILIGARQFLLNNSIIASSAQGNGVGGNVGVSANLLALNNGSQIQANAEDAQAGTIRLITDIFLADKDSIVETTSALDPQLDGSVTVEFQDRQLESPREIAPVQRNIISVVDACSSGDNSITLSNRRLEKLTIDEPELISAAELKRRLEIARQYKFRDENGQVHQFKRWLGVEKLPNGKGRFIYEPSQNKTIQEKLTSLERFCTGIKS